MNGTAAPATFPRDAEAMPRDLTDDWRAAAEGVVRSKFEHQQHQLAERQRQERSQARNVEARAAHEAAARRAVLEEERRAELARNNAEFVRECQRLKLRAALAPTLAPSGMARVSIEAEYRRAQESWNSRRDDITKTFDDRIASHDTEHAERHEHLSARNDLRDAWHDRQRDELDRKQQRNFERLVQREMCGAERGLSGEFQDRSQPRGHGPERGR